ncbi:glycoside hydrolase family 57 protein [Chryseosolibacter indicus]|uniref:Glycoside hydrolase family 57 protein n=1 Tax=Chryseosolibacter indicus TaxID=2782351 RepID=A0ABS5VQE5_9BACT|nr:glycoside hydrolase family 57 protein [Chryseosolibacter indicus]MBT1703677.1 glycoside hydrolase family 57 protein [Chryseosolibacter indicus]
MSLLNNSDRSRNLVFYFQVHQPRRLRTVRLFDIGTDSGLFDDQQNQQILERVAASCYLPTNQLLLKLIKKYPGIKIAFSISGVTLDQFEAFAPEVLESFKDLAETGSVEFLGETYYHSLATLIPGHEFEIQTLKHTELIEKHFGKRPTVFRNTELIYSDDVGRRAALLGFKGVFTDGVARVLSNDKSPNQVYQHPTEEGLSILLRNFILSDDIAFRFSHYSGLTADQYITWLKDIPTHERVVNVAMDYETFGEHHKKESGIFQFLENMLSGIASDSTFKMLTPTEAVDTIKPQAVLDCPHFVSWADNERDLSAWVGNDLQRDAFETLVKLDSSVKALNDAETLKQWRLLQTSDHFYYMSTKKGTDGTIHNYFSPYPSPYEAFINYMNALTDFSVKLDLRKSLLKPVKARKKKAKSLLEGLTA